MSGAPYSMLGTPKPGGAKILSMRELAGIISKSPHAVDAINRINRFEGKPRQAEVLIHEARRNSRTQTLDLNNEYQVAQQARKARGLM